MLAILVNIFKNLIYIKSIMPDAKIIKGSKKEVNKAGNILRDGDFTKKEFVNEIKTINLYRTNHLFPMYVFYNKLTNISNKYDKSALTSRRLKRLPTIINKLKRFPSMNLFQMQDIAGCRTVVKSLEIAKKIYKDEFLKKKLIHKNLNCKDYIENPKEDGYRSLHLVYQYTTKNGGEKYNGTKVEIQIRTRLQHLWATCVETVDLFTLQEMKFGKGKKEWMDFFKLVSKAFFLKDTKKKLDENICKEIRKLEKKLKVIEKLELWRNSIDVLGFKWEKKSMYKTALLIIDLESNNTYVDLYKKEDKTSIQKYSKFEQKYKNRKEYSTVLVGINDLKKLKKNYPNYFADVTDFIHELFKITK